MLLPSARRSLARYPLRGCAPVDSRIIRVVLIYAVFASGWILFSDLLVTSVLSDPQAIHRASTVKGWVFVGVTSLLLWGLLRRLTRSGAAGVAPAETRPGLARWRSLVLPLVLLSIGVVALGYLSVLFIVKQHRAEEYRRIEAIADLKVGQLAMWVNERQSDALVIERNAGLRELLARWQRDNDGRAQASLLSAIEAIRGTYRYAQAALVDADGKVVLKTGGNSCPPRSCWMRRGGRRPAPMGLRRSVFWVIQATRAPCR